MRHPENLHTLLATASARQNKEALRCLLRDLTSEPDAPDIGADVAAEILRLLGLDPTATLPEVEDAIAALFGAEQGPAAISVARALGVRGIRACGCVHGERRPDCTHPDGCGGDCQASRLRAARKSQLVIGGSVQIVR